MKLINLFWGILKKNIHFWNKEIMLHFTNSIYRRTIMRLSVKVDSWPAVQALREELRVSTSGGDARGGSACGPTLYQAGPTLHLIVWGGTHFSLWRVLEHLASTVFCGRLTHLKPDHSLARRSLPQRQAFSGEPQLDRILCSIGWWSSARCPVWVKCVVLDDLTMLLSETTRRGFTTIYCYY